MSEITKCENNLKKYFESLDFILSMLHYESEILLTNFLYVNNFKNKNMKLCFCFSFLTLR